MKAFLSIFSFLVFLTVQIVSGQDSTYYRANALFQEGKYEESIELYESIINSGYESPTLYYNLGNAYFRSNKLGKARLFYERALKLNPSEEDAMENIKYLQNLLADKFEEVPVIFYKKWFSSLLNSMNTNQWALISSICFILSMISFVVYLLFSRRIIRKLGFYISIVLLLISLSSFIASWRLYKLIRYPETAVVTELSVNAKSTPRETGTGLFILHEGAKVWLGDKTGGWQEIRLSDGRKAWVPEKSIEKI